MEISKVIVVVHDVSQNYLGLHDLELISTNDLSLPSSSVYWCHSTLKSRKRIRRSDKINEQYFYITFYITIITFLLFLTQIRKLNDY